MPNTNFTAAELYGKGIFTTIGIREGRPFLWDKHWHRIVSNAACLGLELSWHRGSATRDSLLESVAGAGVVNGRARITVSDESPSHIWSTEIESKTTLSIIVSERRPIPEHFKLTVSRYRINTTSPLVGIKSCNYLEHLLAYEEATKRGFHEAVRLNERAEVASACMANVFWEKDGKLFTPSLRTGCLPGTTREFVLENVDCEEVEAGIEDLRSAARMFLTSAGIGAISVANFDGRRLDGSAHPLTELISSVG
ncbi:MAG: aminotransferase class IV [bacterium]|nr:aminotransferase class IV [bacterium]